MKRKGQFVKLLHHSARKQVWKACNIFFSLTLLLVKKIFGLRLFFYEKKRQIISWVFFGFLDYPTTTKWETNFLSYCQELKWDPPNNVFISYTLIQGLNPGSHTLETRAHFTRTNIGQSSLKYLFVFIGWKHFFKERRYSTVSLIIEWYMIIYNK